MKNKILFLLILCVQKVLFAAAGGGGGSQPPVTTGWFSCFGGRCAAKSAKVSPAQESVEMLDDSPDEHGGGLKSTLYDSVQHRNMLRKEAWNLIENAGPFDYKSYLEAAYLFKNAGNNMAAREAFEEVLIRINLLREKEKAVDFDMTHHGLSFLDLMKPSEQESFLKLAIRDRLLCGQSAKILQERLRKVQEEIKK